MDKPNKYTDMIALMSDPDTLGDFGAYFTEREMVERKEREARAEQLEAMRERGEI